VGKGRGSSEQKSQRAPAPGNALFALVVALGVSGGIALGIGGYTFVYAKGFSYVSNDPGVCANCHVMQGHLDAWVKGSHKNVAVCNDCHTPHNFIGKYYTKGLNGYNHSVAFTLMNFHEPIRITPYNRWVTEQACRYCHADLVEAMDGGSHHAEPADCIPCHSDVGHMH
jgi:cytochrome c nitrite reductase small subunit